MRSLLPILVTLAAIGGSGCGRGPQRAGGTVDGALPDGPAPADGAVSGDAVVSGGDVGMAAPALPRSWQVCATLPPLDPRPSRADAITGLTASRDGRWLAASRWSERPVRVSVWELGADRRPRPIEVGLLAGLSLEFSPDGSRLAAAGDERGVYRIEDGRPVFSIDPEPEVPGYTAGNGLRFSPAGNEVATGDVGRWLTRLTIDGQLLARWRSAVPVPGVAFSPDGSLLATSVPELWRLSDGRRLWAGVPPVLGQPLFVENSAEFSPDGATLLVSTCLLSDFSNVVAKCRALTRLFRVTDGALLADLGEALSRRPKFSPDGAQLVAGPQVMTIASRALTPLPVEALLSVYLPDGRIAAAGSDGTVRILCPQR